MSNSITGKEYGTSERSERVRYSFPVILLDIYSYELVENQYRTMFFSSAFGTYLLYTQTNNGWPNLSLTGWDAATSIPKPYTIAPIETRWRYHRHISGVYEWVMNKIKIGYKKSKYLKYYILGYYHVCFNLIPYELFWFNLCYNIFYK